MEFFSIKFIRDNDDDDEEERDVEVDNIEAAFPSLILLEERNRDTDNKFLGFVFIVSLEREHETLTDVPLRMFLEGVIK